MHKALAHKLGDDVAVAVAAIVAGEEVLVVYVDDDGEETVSATRDVPYGHKIALKSLEAGAPVTEYGTQIGIAVTHIRTGDYVHTHNVRTARW
jgi:(2R)-sulfolactate sulfo-lyase subunit alpha